MKTRAYLVLSEKILWMFSYNVGSPIISTLLGCVYSLKKGLYYTNFLYPSSCFQLCCEVRSNRRGPGLDSRKQDDNAANRLSIRSTSTGSSLLSDNSRSELLSSSTQSEPTRNPPSPGFGHSRNITQPSTCSQVDSPCGFSVGAQFGHSDRLQPELVDEFRSRETWQQDSEANNKKGVDTTELEAFYCGVTQEYSSKGSEKGVPVSPQESAFWKRLSYGSDKKKNTTALNAVSVLDFCFCLSPHIYKVYFVFSFFFLDFLILGLVVFLLSSDHVLVTPQLISVDYLPHH